MESRVRENFMHGLMRGHQRQGDGRLERDTRLKREKRYLLTSPGHYCAGVLLYKPATVVPIERDDTGQTNKWVGGYS